MPTVISINILTYNIRKDNPDVLQPFMLMYTKPPLRKAISQFGGYNVQLPNLLKMKPDFSSELYCWLYTIYTAHKENKTISEVIGMIPELQEYARNDAGFMQFCDQYELVAADPQTRSEYFIWYNNRMREVGMYEAAREIGREEGREIGREIGREESETNAILRLLQIGMDVATISKVYDKSEEEIKKLIDEQKKL